jgi:tetratricopeptide (TPR) repeat protein
MKNIHFFLLVLLLITVGCNTPVNVTNFKDNAEKAEAAGDYVIATEAWKFYFNQLTPPNEPDQNLYARAAHTAYRGGDFQQAIEWFEQARLKGYEKPDLYLTLAEMYRSLNNVSEELSALEYYNQHFEVKEQEIFKRLFEIYFSADRTAEAIDAWHKMPDVEKGTEQNLERYFILNKQLGNDETADSVSLELLSIAPEHVDALEWQAQKNYEKAESRYQQEMKKYQQRPTSGNYQTLLRQLKAATSDFRKSLQYFEKLWEVNPDSRKEYAVYMNNIHIRFNDKQKADYYRDFVN